MRRKGVDKSIFVLFPFLSQFRIKQLFSGLRYSGNKLKPGCSTEDLLKVIRFHHYQDVQIIGGPFDALQNTGDTAADHKTAIMGIKRFKQINQLKHPATPGNR